MFKAFLDLKRDLKESVSVKKQNYSWGKMVTVHHGKDTSYPLHPEHQQKIKSLSDGESTSFNDETNRKVTAKRDGDTIHLSARDTNKTTAVSRSHFAEEVEQIEELKASTLNSYIAKRQGNTANRMAHAMRKLGGKPSKHDVYNTGLKRAQQKIDAKRKEETGMNPQKPRPAQPPAYPLGGRDPASGRSYSEEYESVPASKALQKAHDDERKKRGLPDPSYYLKLAAQKKKEIEDMKKNEEAEIKEEQKYYSLVHKSTNKVLSTHKDLESAKDEHRGMDQGVRAHYRIATSTKEPKTFNMKEEAKDTNPPFSPDKPKKQAIAGKYGPGYSTARHLARMGIKAAIKDLKKGPEKGKRQVEAVSFKSLRTSLAEKTLTKPEMKKREEVAKAIERDNPGMPMQKKMAIATATAKRVA